jgi:hypothetical protein
MRSGARAACMVSGWGCRQSPTRRRRHPARALLAIRPGLRRRVGDELTTLQRRPERLNFLIDHALSKASHQHLKSLGCCDDRENRRIGLRDTCFGTNTCIPIRRPAALPSAVLSIWSARSHRRRKRARGGGRIAYEPRVRFHGISDAQTSLLRTKTTRSAAAPVIVPVVLRP